MANRPELKQLSSHGKVDRKILRGAIRSLEFVELNVKRPGVLLENLFEVAPRLNWLKLNHGNHDHFELQFICEKFSYLQHLEVNVKDMIAADNSVRFDRLAHLQELKLLGLSNIRYIHRNNVRCLTMLNSTVKGDELKQIPEKFPALKRLILEKRSVSLAGVERLHKLMPSCRIDYGNNRFYPVDDGTSK
ncbi:uncharacterized protein LOC131205478 [Anopheles bellator]|uniref:uncharacterized protein LOC131205478 n=1 Tax=Anopheles bellator TaxID=139047 RepID=UPI002649B2AC|nr:uncharacterized protein LOC131205478 [Anopheles bellator]